MGNGISVESAPTALDFAQLAAIIDCEGHIAINSDKSHRKHHLQVTVGNRDIRLLEWCRARFGGRIYRNIYHKDRGPNFAQVRRWRLQGPEASSALDRCQSYFIIKIDQARIAVRFQATFDNQRRRLTESVLEFRENLMRELRSLTHKGPRGERTESSGRDESKRLSRDRNLLLFSNGKVITH